MEINFTTIDLTPYLIGGVAVGLIVAACVMAAFLKEGLRPGQRFLPIIASLLMGAIVSSFGLLVGYMVALTHAGNERTAAFERLSSELGVEVIADRSITTILANPETVTVLSEPFTISYEIDGAVYQPTVVAKPVESSGNSHRFALYIQPGTNGELIALNADSMTTASELEDPR